MRETPVLLLEGPRTVGKSTLLRQLADETGGFIIDLDDPDVRSVVSDDPNTWASRPGPVFIDEYQHVPEVLDTIKARLNHSSRPGQFVLTGSSHFDSLPRTAQSLTGRLLRLPVLPLAACEMEGTGGLLPKLADVDALLAPAAGTSTRPEYIARIVDGGFPIALAQSSSLGRSRWFDQYVALTLQRDVTELSRLQQARLLPVVLDKVMGQTAQIMNTAHIAREVNLSPTTVGDYVRLLEAVFLVQTLPAWAKTLESRAARRPKIHAIDSGVAARLLGLTDRKLDRLDPSVQTEFGHLVETFVVGELLKEASWTDEVADAGHWRTHDGLEVDLVLETYDGDILAFEVKAGSRVPSGGFRALEALRDAAGSAFRLGVTLYMGEQPYRFGDRLIALPIDTLWKP